MCYSFSINQNQDQYYISHLRLKSPQNHSIMLVIDFKTDFQQILWHIYKWNFFLIKTKIIFIYKLYIESYSWFQIIEDEYAL